MDKIWDRKSFEVRSHWPLWQGWKNKLPCRTNAKIFVYKMCWFTCKEKI